MVGSLVEPGGRRGRRRAMLGREVGQMMSVIRGPWRVAGVVMMAAVALTVAGGTAGPAAASGTGPRAAVPAAPPLGPRFSFPGGVPSPLRPDRPDVIVGDSELSGVFCALRTDCWTVGDDENNNVVLNQVLHFNGTKWSHVKTPQPGGTAIDDESALASVWCTSAANCWAVGSYRKNDATRSQALHWNGKKWSQAPTPTVGGTIHGDFNDLADVVCTSARNCWAGGDYGGEVDSNEVSLNLVLHWNGTRWSHARTPNPAGTKPGDISALSAIRCPSAADCWGVGTSGVAGAGTSMFDNEVLHWNGTKWSDVTVPSPGTSDNGDVDNALNSLSCTSAKNCFAVGDDTGPAADRNQSLHWNGKHWRTASTPDPTGMDASSELSGVSCTTDTNCWAVGNGTSGAHSINEALHWNGRKWFAATVPEPAGTAMDSENNLIGVRCLSATDCWAVGYTQKFAEPEVNQILHWTGKKWIAVG
jgi:hypothetical protein